MALPRKDRCRIFTVLLYNTLDGPHLLLSKHRHIWHLQGSYFPHKAFVGYLDTLLADESMLLEFFESKIALHWDRAIRILEIFSARYGLPNSTHMGDIRKVKQLEQLCFSKRLYGFMVRKKHDQVHELSEVHFHKTTPLLRFSMLLVYCPYVQCQGRLFR